MKTTLSKKELVFIASMLFGLFFGAGNLIFPIYMGQMAGRHMWQATIGFLITGVGLPLMGVAAMGISRSKAYQIVREMNRELKSQGYLTVAGKCPAQYFKQKFYGFQIPGGERNDGK